MLTHCLEIHQLPASTRSLLVLTLLWSTLTIGRYLKVGTLCTLSNGHGPIVLGERPAITYAPKVEHVRGVDHFAFARGREGEGGAPCALRT